MNNFIILLDKFPEGLNSEQLGVWLSNHPKLRKTDYQHDIGKLKGCQQSIMGKYVNIVMLSCHYIIEAKISGDNLLGLRKSSLEQFGLSTEFQILLMKIIEDMVNTANTVRGFLENLINFAMYYRNTNNLLKPRHFYNQISKSPLGVILPPALFSILTGKHILVRHSNRIRNYQLLTILIFCG